MAYLSSLNATLLNAPNTSLFSTFFFIFNQLHYILLHIYIWLTCFLTKICFYFLLFFLSSFMSIYNFWGYNKLWEFLTIISSFISHFLYKKLYSGCFLGRFLAWSFDRNFPFNFLLPSKLYCKFISDGSFCDFYDIWFKVGFSCF